MEGNDKKNESIFKTIGIFVTIIVIILLYFMPKLVYGSNSDIKLGEWVQYYGVALGGVITGCGLFISFRINAKELKKQRGIDDRKFNKQMKIQIINEKINDYKKCIELINEFVDINDILYRKIEEYWENLSSFGNMLNIINDARDTLSPSNSNKSFDTIYKQGESSNNVFNLDDINEYVLKSSNELQEIKVYSKCITQESIINKIEEYSRIFEESSNCYTFIIDFDYKNGFTEKYSDYFENEKKLYKIFTTRKYEMSVNITKFYKVIGDTKVKFMSMKPLITDEVGKLYEEKYNLDKNNNEQNMSNNI